MAEEEVTTQEPGLNPTVQLEAPDPWNEVKKSQAIFIEESHTPVTDTNDQSLHNDPRVPVTIGDENVSKPPVLPFPE